MPLAARSSRASASARCEAERRLDGDEERVGVERLLEEVSAPRRVACTAVSIVAWPLIMMTGTSFFAARICAEEADAVAVGERDVEEAEVVGCASSSFSSATFTPPATSTV